MTVGHAGHLPPGPEEDGTYHVYALCYGQGRTRRVHDNFMFRDLHDGPMPIDYNIWVLHNRHRTVLVDTGFGERAAAERGRPLDVDPLEGLRRIGVDPDAIEDVILTHLHYDHAGNLGRFDRARLHVQDAEVAFATGRCMCHTLLRWPFDVEDVTTLVRRIYGGRVCFHDGDAAPLPGLSLHVLPGHSKGMQAVRVQTPRGPVVLASDVVHFYANLVRQSPFSLTVDLADTLQSYAALLALAGGLDRIVPGHDPRVRTLYPQLRVGGLSLSVLHETPAPHDPARLARVDDGADMPLPVT